MPHALRSVERESDVLANFKVLAGTEEDLANDITRVINRLRSLWLRIHPAFERVIEGSVLSRSIVMYLLIRYRGPVGLHTAGKSRVKRWTRSHARKDPSTFLDAILDALAEQTVIVPGSEASESAVPRHAASRKGLKAECKEVEADAEELADSLPLLPVLTSMPGVGVKTASQILLAPGDFTVFGIEGLPILGAQMDLMDIGLLVPLRVCHAFYAWMTKLAPQDSFGPGVLF